MQGFRPYAERSKLAGELPRWFGAAGFHARGDQMSMFSWKDSYRVEVEEIDQQHRTLIAMVDELHQAMRGGKGKEVLGEILKKLVQYTQTHFAAEERLMAKHGYPEYEEHRARHERMREKVLDIQRQYQEGRISLTLDVMNYLENWVDTHILGTDMKYAPFFQSKGLS
jgi:hemerythrin